MRHTTWLATAGRSCQNIICPAVIYLPGTSERKAVGVVKSTETRSLRFAQTPAPDIGSEFAMPACVSVSMIAKMFKLCAQVVEVEEEARSQANCCLCWFLVQ